MENYSLFPKANNSKKYLTKKIEEKVLALKIMDVLDNDVKKKIFKTAFPKYFECMCSENFLCNNCKYACCEKAQIVFCMCLCSTKCEVHGHRCNGSHD